MPNSATDKRNRGIYHEYPSGRGNVMKTFRYTAFACIVEYFWSDCVCVLPSSQSCGVFLPQHMQKCKMAVVV